MKFDRLQAAIANRADQEPSLYMALCMTEALFLDIQKAAGTDFGHVPVGDERLPSKLVWLCNQILAVYNHKDEELQRNRAMLDMATGKLADTRASLEGYAAAAEEMQAVKAEYAQLQQQLAAAAEVEAQLQQLKTQCSLARQRLEQLRQLDPEQLKAQLQGLNNEINNLECHNTVLEVQVQQAKNQAQSLQTAIEDRNADNSLLQQQLSSLNQTLSQKEAACQQLQSQYDQARARLEATQAHWQTLSDGHAQMTQQRVQMEERILLFQADELNPLEEKLQQNRQALASLETSKAPLEQELAQLQEARSQLTLDIARQTGDNDALKEKLAVSQATLSNLQQEKTALEASTKKLTEQLEALQEQVALIKEQKLPEVLHLKQQEQTRRDALQADLENHEAERSQLKEAIDRLEADGPQLEEKLQDARALYDALSATSIANSNELTRLEAQIKELSDQNNDRRRELLHSQLTQKHRSLQELADDCVQLTQENERLQGELDKSMESFAKLKELKQRIEAGREALQKQQLELNFTHSERNVQLLQQLTAQLALLEAAGTKLAASMEAMRKTLGSVPAQQTDTLEESFLRYLRDLRSQTEDLRQKLLACAKGLKLEEVQ